MGTPLPNKETSLRCLSKFKCFHQEGILNSAIFFKKTGVFLLFLFLEAINKKVNPMQGRLKKLHGRLGTKHL